MSSSSASASSSTIGGFKIVRKLSQGSQSVTYLATPPPEVKARLAAAGEPSDHVVLKRIASNVLRPSDVNVFLKLRHPGIVPCHAALQHEDQLVLVTPFYEAGDLDHHIAGLAKAKRRLDSETVTSWMVQLIRALRYCHENRVIHRDLKLGSVFVSRDLKKVYLGGFGLARALDRTMNNSTATTLVGSPVNLSPEVISGQPYSLASDVWSLGCLVYELLTFEKPFSSPSFAQVVLKVCNGQFEPLPSSVPKHLKAAVNGMLQVDPKQRWVLAEVVESDEVFIAVERQLEEEATSARATVGGGAQATEKKSQQQQQQPSQPPQQQQQQQQRRSMSPASDPAAHVASPSSSEELEQWVQWKMREFAQIELALRKLGGPEPSTGNNNNNAPGKQQMYKFEAPPATTNVIASSAAAGASAAAALDPKRAQRMLPSPRKPDALAKADSGMMPPLPIAPRGGRRAVKAVVPAAAPHQAQAQPQQQSIAQQQQQQKKEAELKKQQQQQQQEEAEKQRKAAAAAAVAESAEKRQAQRDELRKRMAEGRKAAQGAGPDVVVATPSRPLNMRDDDVADDQQQQQRQRASPGQQRKLSSSVSKANNNNVENSNNVAASPASAPAGGKNNNNTPSRASNIKDEIAKRRAEAKMSPRGLVGSGGPELEIVMPANIKRAMEGRK